MTASHTRALSRQAGALLGAIAGLVAGCTAAGGGSGPRAAQAGAAPGVVAESPSGHSSAHRAGRTTRPGGAGHGGGSRIAPVRSLPLCAYAAGRPVADPGGAPSSSRVAPAVCWWACCGCGPSRWPPAWPPRSHLAWPCCQGWPWSPGDGPSPMSLACGDGCGSGACPVGAHAPVPRPAGAAVGSSGDRVPGGVAGGAS